jgi:hypothetical protein
MDGINYKGDPRAVLCHFNEKHDSNGRFAKKSGASSSTTSTTKAPKLFDDDKITKYKGHAQDILSEGFDDIASTKLKKDSKAVRQIAGSPATINYATSVYLSKPAIADSEWLNSKIGGPRQKDESDYMKAGLAITANIVQDYKLAAQRAGIPNDVINEAFGGEFVDQVAEEVGKQLGEIYNSQSAAPLARQKKVDKKAKGSVEKRAMSRDDLKKQYPDVPSAALDVMMKSISGSDKKSMRGGSSMPSSTVKHDLIDYTGDPRAVLCHYNPNHDPKTGQFTSKRFGSSKRYGDMNSDPSFGMGKYIRIDENGKKVLTEAGRARWEHDKKRNDQKKKEDRVKDPNSLIDPHRWVKEDLDAVQQGLQNAQNMAKSLSDFEKKKLAQRPLVRKKKLDLSEMTDQDLNNQINRYVLEQRYLDIFNPKEPPEVSKGKKWLMNTLEVAGGALAVGASAVTIAKAVHDMKKGA